MISPVGTRTLAEILAGRKPMTAEELRTLLEAWLLTQGGGGAPPGVDPGLIQALEEIEGGEDDG